MAVVYRLVSFSDASEETKVEYPDGRVERIVTLTNVHKVKHEGGTNRAVVEDVTIGGREYKVIKKFL